MRFPVLFRASIGTLYILLVLFFDGVILHWKWKQQFTLFVRGFDLADLYVGIKGRVVSITVITSATAEQPPRRSYFKNAPYGRAYINLFRAQRPSVQPIAL